MYSKIVDSGRYSVESAAERCRNIGLNTCSKSRILKSEDSLIIELRP